MRHRVRSVAVVLAVALAGTALAVAPAAATDPAGVERLDRWVDDLTRVRGISPTDLGVPGWYGAATMISDSGVVAGTMADDQGRWRVFRWKDGVATLLQDDGLDAYAVDMNERGQVVGHVRAADGWERAVLWEPDGTVVDMAPGRNDLRVYGIDDHGRVAVNRHSGQLGYSDPAIWHDGELIELLGYGGTGSVAPVAPLNNRGEVVGTTTGSRAFVWRDGVTTVLESPSGAATSAMAITENGTVVGTAADGEGRSRTVVWEQGRMRYLDLGGITPELDRTDVDRHGTVVTNRTNADGTTYGVVAGRHGTVRLRTLGGPSSRVFAISDLGLVVGEAQRRELWTVPVVWVLGVPVPLGDRLHGAAPAVGGSALDVNNRGQVVGDVGGVPVIWDLRPRR